MATAHDVAAYIVALRGSEIDTWSLQKLVYYSQAWAAVWDERPLFSDRIEAWRDGPVVPTLFYDTRNVFRVDDIPKGDADALTAEQKATIEAVFSFYGRLDGKSLRALTHREAPWTESRRGLPLTAHSNEAISPDAMRSFYGKLATNGKNLPDGLMVGIDILLSVPEERVSKLFTATDMSVDEVFAP